MPPHPVALRAASAFGLFDMSGIDGDAAFALETDVVDREPTTFLPSQREILKPGKRADGLISTPGIGAVTAIILQCGSPPARDRLVQQTKDALMPGGMIRRDGNRPDKRVDKIGELPEVENLYTIAILNEDRRHKGRTALVAGKPENEGLQ